MKNAKKPTTRLENRVQRQTQILDAARACVRVDGFAASLSRIAAQASMSGGHIYQYFETKEAIMIALCERDFEDFMLQMSHFGQHVASDRLAVIEALSSEIMSLFSHDRSALTLEIIAEAERNPKFLDLVLRADERIRSAFRTIIEPLLPGLTRQEIDERAETLLVMARGLAVHMCMRPASDYHLLAATFKFTLRGVLSAKSDDPERESLR